MDLMSKFHIRALFDLYASGTQNDRNDIWSSLSTCTNLMKAEIKLCKILNVKCRNIYSTLMNRESVLEFAAQLSVKDIALFSHTLKFSDPVVRQKSCIFYRQYGHERFFTVSVKDMMVSECSMKICESFCTTGFVFGGRQYHFLGGELKKINKSGSNSDKNNSNFTKIMLWFFATHEVEESVAMKLPPYIHSEPFKVIHIADVRNFLGDFQLQQASKINARIKLGFSSTLAAITFDNHCIEEIPDVYGCDKVTGAQLTHDSACMTDGCGYISHFLAQQIPYGIKSGVPFNFSKLDRNGNEYNSKVYKVRDDNTPLPCIIQVRITSSKGLYKGCLIVTNNDKLCTPYCVAVRPSMRKAPGSIHHTHHKAVLNVNDTFEKPELLYSGNANRTEEVCAAHLNRDVCLLLRHLGVPTNCFLALMQEELSKVLTIHSSVESAYSAVRKEKRREMSELNRNTDRAAAAGSDSEGEEEDGENDNSNTISVSQRTLGTVTDEDGECVTNSDVVPDHNNNRVKNPNAYYSTLFNRIDMQADLAHSFLSSGHSLDEPMLRQLLRSIQLRHLNILQRCNLKLQNSVYLVGAPDPLGVLKEGEVFVSLHDDREVVSPTRIAPIVEGRVVTARNPMHHPGDIRTLSAVYNKDLVQFLQGSNGGVIFFSTEGERRAADLMSGGDYDGDEFLVIYGRSEFVTAVTEVSPYTAPKGKADNTSSSNDNDKSPGVSSATTPTSPTRSVSNVMNSNSTGENTPALQLYHPSATPHPSGLVTPKSTFPISPAKRYQGAPNYSEHACRTSSHISTCECSVCVSTKSTTKGTSVDRYASPQPTTRKTFVSPSSRTPREYSGPLFTSTETVQPDNTATLSHCLANTCSIHPASSYSTAAATDRPSDRQSTSGEQSSWVPESPKRPKTNEADVYESPKRHKNNNAGIHQETDGALPMQPMKLVFPVTDDCDGEGVGDEDFGSDELIGPFSSPTAVRKSATKSIGVSVLSPAASSSVIGEYSSSSNSNKTSSTNTSTKSSKSSPTSSNANINNHTPLNNSMSTHVSTTSTTTTTTTTITADTQDQHSALSTAIFQSLLQTSASSLVGKYCNAWRVWADYYAPDHPNALECDHWSRLALDCAKSGEIVPDIASLTCTDRVGIPHHMRTEANVFKHTFKSTSVIGQMYDLAQDGFKNMDVMGERLEEYLEKDPDILIVIDDATGEDMLERVKHTTELFKVFDSWKAHLTAYKKAVAEVLEGLVPTELRTDKGVDNNSDANSDDNAINNSVLFTADYAFQSPVQQNKSTAPITPSSGLFSLSSGVKASPQKITRIVSTTSNNGDIRSTAKSPKFQSPSRYGQSSKSSHALDEDHKNQLIEELKVKYIEFFDQQSRDLQTIFGFSLKISRLLLATVVYTVTYDKAQLKNGKYSLSFCWEICPTELHYLKKQSMLHKEQQSPLADVLNSQKTYL